MNKLVVQISHLLKRHSMQQSSTWSLLSVFKLEYHPVVQRPGMWTGEVVTFSIILSQRQYCSLWGLSEAWSLLVENFTQYPARMTWNTVSFGNFCQSLERLTSLLQKRSLLCVVFCFDVYSPEIKSVKVWFRYLTSHWFRPSVGQSLPRISRWRFHTTPFIYVGRFYVEKTKSQKRF